MESNDIRELFTKEIVEKANKEMTDYAVSDELALKMMIRATNDAAFQNFLGNYVIGVIGKIIEKLEAEN
jgi:hypothetical protein